MTDVATEPVPLITDLREIERFIYLEARLADEHDYDAWEALWEDDAIYWVPVDGGDYDPLTRMSIIYDNRRRIGTRMEQLRTGKRYAQSPPSNLRRLVTNIEVLEADGAESVVGANFAVYESKERGTRIWAGRYRYRLRATEPGLRLVEKTVVLVNSAETVPTLGFIV